jgi:hypothetical protein
MAASASALKTVLKVARSEPAKPQKCRTRGAG